MLQTSQETSTPLALVNTGQRAWDPASVHLSYHWLWIVPRELARRSRTLPYHDGIRTDLGDRPIPPGAQTTVQGRLLAPDFPGVYWLQWDMVEEGVTDLQKSIQIKSEASPGSPRSRRASRARSSSSRLRLHICSRRCRSCSPSARSM